VAEFCGVQRIEENLPLSDCAEEQRSAVRNHAGSHGAEGKSRRLEINHFDVFDRKYLEREEIRKVHGLWKVIDGHCKV
jgi:hypothetical protein